jgi:hypothetical protein
MPCRESHPGRGEHGGVAVRPLPLRVDCGSAAVRLVMIGMLALAWWTRGHNSWPWCGTLGSLRPARRKDLCAGPQSVYTEQRIQDRDHLKLAFASARRVVVPSGISGDIVGCLHGLNCGDRFSTVGGEMWPPRCVQ